MKRTLVGKRIGLAFGMAGLLALAACGSGADKSSADFPNRAVTIVSPFPAGGVTDGVARAYGPCVSKELGQNVIVENKTGGGGVVGHKQIVSGKADGYTLLSTQASPVDVTPLYTPSVGYTPKDFTYIARVYNVTGGLFVSAKTPYKTIEEYIAAVRKKPGSVTYGIGTPTGSLGAIAEALQNDHNLPVQSVPFNGGAEVDTALIGGHIDSAGAAITKGRLDLVATGKLRLLAAMAGERVKVAPEVPTLKESGIDFTHGDEWFGMLAPPELDKAIATKLAEAFKACQTSDPVVNGLGADWIPAEFLAGDAFKDLSLSVFDEFKRSGIKPKG